MKRSAASILLLQLAQEERVAVGRFGRAHLAEPFLPALERLLGDSELAVDLRDRCAGFSLPQSEADLLL